MRIAINAVGEVGTRAGFILLAERDLEALGVYGPGSLAAERRARRITELAGFDLLVTDDPTPETLASIAVEDGLHCVASGDVPVGIAERFAAAGRTLLVGADLAGLAATLAAHEAMVVPEVESSTVAWTRPGEALRRGVGVGFPDPVGARWGEDTGSGIVAPVPGEWAAASVVVRGRIDGRSAERMVGVADQRAHLEAIALAAGALAVSRGAYGPGSHRPESAAAPYLDAMLSMGLGVARHAE